MTVKDIIKKSAELLNLKKVSDYLGDENAEGDTETLAAVNKLTGLTNLVLNELSLSYLPMKEREEMTVTDGKISFSSLSKTPYRVLNVFDIYGETAFYTLTSTGVKVSVPKAVIEYAYIPSNYGLSDVVGYTETEISSRLIAYALCAEYLVTVSAFSEAVMWRKRFTEELEELVVPKSRTMKSRRFI